MKAAPAVVVPKPVPAYPKNDIAHALRGELIAAVRDMAARKGQALPPNDGDLVVLGVEIDSLTAVEILCVLDDLLPFMVGESVVRAGGYGSINEAVTHVVGRVEKEWGKHHQGG